MSEENINQYKIWVESDYYGEGGTEWVDFPTVSNLNEKQKCCFCNEHIVSIVFGEGTLTIGEKTFEYQPYLSSVKFPKTLVSIEKRAFCNGHDLESVNLPESVRNIGDIAFLGCYPYINLHISKLENVGKFPFGFSHVHQHKRMPIIDCGFIQNEDEGNKFPFLNCYRRMCYKRLNFSDGNHFTVRLFYPEGEPLNPEEYLYTAENTLNMEHSGFQGTQPEVRISNWKELNIVITLCDLDGTERTINGFFQQREGHEDFQALVNSQYEEITEADWSIVLPWHDKPVKQLGCLELLEHCYHEDFDITEPILRVFDNPSEPEPVK